MAASTAPSGPSQPSPSPVMQSPPRATSPGVAAMSPSVPTPTKKEGRWSPSLRKMFGQDLDSGRTSPVPGSPTPQHPVRATLIRHGEAAHNENQDNLTSAGRNLMQGIANWRVSTLARDSHDVLRKVAAGAMMRDPVLTALGVEQASRLALKLAPHSFEVVYVSPMRRTIQTAVELFATRSPRPLLVLQPLCCESRTLLEGANAGQTRDELQAALPKEVVDMLDWSFVPDGCWWIRIGETADQLASRAYRFRLFLLQQPYENVCVVTHGHFLKALIADPDVEWRNCECHTYNFKTDGSTVRSADGPHDVPPSSPRPRK
eukprot:Sspe_Gene.75303::Locus_47054_Transcript_1_1_Confidence_1.000_Length_1097::g.75303::m.75303